MKTVIGKLGGHYEIAYGFKRDLQSKCYDLADDIVSPILYRNDGLTYFDFIPVVMVMID